MKSVSITITADARPLVRELKEATQLILSLSNLFPGRIRFAGGLEEILRPDVNSHAAPGANKVRAVFKPSNRLRELVLTLRALQRNGFIVEHNGGGWVLSVATTRPPCKAKGGAR